MLECSVGSAHVKERDKKQYWLQEECGGDGDPINPQKFLGYSIRVPCGVEIVNPVAPPPQEPEGKCDLGETAGGCFVVTIPTGAF